MALSAKAKRRLEVAMARRQEANEVIAAIEAGGNTPAAAVAPIGAQTPAVDQTTTNANIAAVAAKVDAVIAALKAAGLMLP